MRRILFAAVAATILVLGGQSEILAQSFGKNKVQYDDLTWYYIQTDHFDIYFSNGGEDIAEFTAKAAEDALGKIQDDLRYRITNRIPMIIYNSHNDFQQTNVVGLYLEEGIGGVTELFKNRVVLPFTGSYGDFRHVIHHELIHAVINDMFYGGSLQAVLANQIRLQLPLWLNEGLAEYHSLDGWDTNSDMFMRDASTSNYLPPIKYLGGYFAYRGGQSVWWYISEKYGKQKVGEIMNRIRATRSVDRGFKSAIGLDVEELSERWMKEQKVMYWPDIATRTSPEDYAKRLTDHQELGNFYNTSPAMSPSGDKIAFISERDDYFSVYLMSVTDEEEVEKIIEGQSTSDFEDLNLLTPGISFSPDGKKIAFSGKSGGADAIHIIDLETREHETLDYRMEGIHTVSWSPTGEKIAFVGITSRQSDIWTYDLETKEAVAYTSDQFADESPSWSADGKTIYFVSDRKQYLNSASIPEGFSIFDHDLSQRDIYSLNIDTKQVTRLTDTPLATEANPAAHPDGKRLMYISDKNGINNFYVHDLETGNAYPITNSLSGVYQFALSADGNKLAFASMFEAGFDLFLLRSPFDKEKIEDLEPTEFVKRRNQDMARVADKEALESAEGPFASNEVKDYSDDVAVELGTKQQYDDTTATRKGESRMLFGTYDKDRDKNKPDDVTSAKKVTEDGDYIVSKYKLSFSPDLVYGNAGYSTFYGVLGTTTMAFSDMLGNHQIIFLTNLLGDLKNSDYALAYFYLPDRIDWSVQGFHSARFLRSFTDRGDFIYRYRQFGGGLSASYPLDRFYRVEGGLTFMNISQENLDIPEPDAERTVILPSVGFVHDNTLWGGWAPMKGTRYELRAFGSPGIGSRPLSFGSVTFDYRTYYKITDGVSFVMRGSGGASFGANPQQFFIGGVENWINRTFEGGHIPIDDVEDFAFLTPALPLRGYNYNAIIASKYGLANFELRFPLVQYFLGGVLPYILQTMNGALFIDVGTAFDEIDNYRAFNTNASGETINQNVLAGTGFGTRMFFLGFPLKFDVAWAFKGEKFASPKYYISLGAEF